MGSFVHPIVVPFGGDPVPLDPQVAASLYGVDLLMSDSQLVASPSGDYTEVGGLQYIRQWIFTCLITDPGEFAVRPDFGCGIGQFLKKPASTSNIDLLKHRITDQISKNKLIEKINSIDVVKTKFGLQAGLVVTISVLIKGRVVQFKPFNFVLKG